MFGERCGLAAECVHAGSCTDGALQRELVAAAPIRPRAVDTNGDAGGKGTDRRYSSRRMSVSGDHPRVTYKIIEPPPPSPPPFKGRLVGDDIHGWLLLLRNASIMPSCCPRELHKTIVLLSQRIHRSWR